MKLVEGISKFNFVPNLEIFASLVKTESVEDNFFFFFRNILLSAIYFLGAKYIDILGFLLKL